MRLADYLRITGTTVHAFAATVEVLPQTIYRILDGTREPSAALARRIHQATSGACTPNDLYLRSSEAA